jgi:hypothetical protein
VAVVSPEVLDLPTVKRCATVRTRDGIEYLCGLCRRQLGYRVPQKPPRGVGAS